MSGNDDKNVGVSSCISGIFEPIKGSNGGQNNWAFCYNQSQNTTNLTVTICTPAVMIEPCNQHLEAPLSLADVNQMVNWLLQIRLAMQNGQSSDDDDKKSMSTTISISRPTIA